MPLCTNRVNGYAYFKTTLYITSTNVNGRLARTEFLNHFSDFFLIQQIHMNLTNSIEMNNSLKFLNEFTSIPQ